MATADLFVRLGLLSDGYVQGIRSAKESTARLEQAMGSAKAALGKIAAAVGVAGGAYEAFNRTMAATQTTADAYDVAIAGAKAATDSFFQSLSTGDWSNFLSNMGYAIEQGMQLQRILDELGDKNDAFSYVKSDSRVALAKARDIIYDPNSTKEQKEEALKQARELIDHNKRIAEEVATKTREAMVTTAKIALKGDITSDELDHFFKQLLPGLDEGFNSYLNQHAELTAKIANERAKYHQTILGDGTIVRQRDAASELKEAELKKELNQLQDRNKQLDKYRVLNDRLTDAKRTEVNTYKESIATIEEYNYMSSATLSRMEKRISEEGKSKGATATKATLTEIQKIDKAINDLRNKLHKLPETATDKIKDIQGKIKELEGKKLRLDVISKVNPEELTRQITSDVRPYEVPIVVAAASIDKIRKQIERIDAKLKLTTDAKEIQKLQAERAKLIKDSDALKGNFGLKVPEGALKQYKAEAESTIDTNQDLVNSFNAISNAISTISGDAESGAAAFFRWGASVASAIGTAVPAITALTTAKKAEATANAAAMATGAGSSVASVPFAGPVMAVAAVASVLAAIANLPKFATGGIVGGNSYHGDKILARLNSGEMVLNHRQISTLGGILANEGKTQGGKVEFVIRGQELVGILDKHSRRQSRT